jgi:TolB-like protein
MGEWVEFGRFRVFTGRRELWADGRPAPIGARALDLLIALVNRPGELVTKDELLALVWSGAAVEDGAITAQIAAVRRALGDGENGARYVQTVPGRGYRFVDEIRRFADRITPPAQTTWVSTQHSLSLAAEPPEAGEAPSLAVLPFNNRSALPEDDVLAEGMVEDVISALAQGVNLRVLGSASTSGLRKGSFADLAAIGRRLGVRYLLEGNVRRIGADLRVTTQLLDAATGAVLWTGKFDRPLTQLAALQEDLVLEVAASLDGRVASLEMARALRKPRDLTAWEAVMRSIAAYRNAGDARGDKPLEEAKLAVAIAPDYGLAHAQLAFTRAALYFRRSPDDEAEVQAIREVIGRAIALSPEDGFVLSSIGGALAFIGFAHDARAHLLRSIRRMPGNGLAHMNLGFALNLLNRPDEALPHLDTAARLMPDSPLQDAIHARRSNAFLRAGRWEDAEAAIDVAITLNPERNRGEKALLCRRAGREEEAQREFKLFRRSGLSLEQMEMSRRRAHANSPALDELLHHLRTLWTETEPRVVG